MEAIKRAKIFQEKKFEIFQALYEKSKDFTKAVLAYENVVQAGISDYYENATLQSARIAYFEIHDYTKSKSYFQLLLQFCADE